jgi:acyl carrier protein
MGTTLSDTYTVISEILEEILDIDPNEVTPETYLIRDLGVESIDLMELTVSLNERFNIMVDEEVVFLAPLRTVIQKARQERKEPSALMMEKFSFLSSKRIFEILEDVKNGPVLKVKDIVRYIDSQSVK